ncbi:MAG TPA: TonB-dependent receptor [Parafilimonas sp.]|nr:TonB-dependent receptor [Parafilimonas sp.]
MKLTFVIILISSLHVSAKGFSQDAKVTLNMRQAPVSKILKAIEKQTTYKFVYSNDLFPGDYKVNVTVNKVAVADVLSQVLDKSGFTFRMIDENTIVITKIPTVQPSATIHGKVTTEKGEPLEGVTVSVDKPVANTMTDSKGEYTITADENATITFSFVGYESQTVPVGTSTEINVSLRQSTSSLSDVVVIGYGTVKKSDLTGSVSSVNSKDVTRTPTGNLVSALQGQAAGVQVIQPSGAPGTAPIIRIRGANSLTGGNNNPLYVVDGMILTTIGSDFSLDDVESIQILKDASATAIYGSRGANGVVIITTKRGSSGQTQVDYDGYAGVQTMIKKLQLLDATQYKDYYTQSRQNATTATQIDTSITNSGSNTDWQDEVYQNALIQNHTVSVRGGTNLSKYYTSINYFQQDGIIRNTDFSRLSLRFNGDHALFDKLQLSESILLSYTNGHGVLGDEVVSNGVAWARPTQPVLDANGKPTVVSVPYARTNPRSLVDNVTNQNTGYRVVGNIILDYKILKGLSLKVNTGAEVLIPVNNYYVPTTLTESSYMGSARKTYGSVVSWINENTLNYSTQINKNNSINAVAGITFQDTKTDGVRGASSGYVIDGFQYNNLGAGTVQTSGSSFSEYSLLSYLGRINYTYKDRWLLTLSGRYDGSSRLAEGHKYAFFPSGALAWRMSQEDFLKNSTVISDLKLRASWGKTGNQTVAPYSTFAQLTPTNVYLDGSPSPTIGYVPATVANGNLGWETTTQTDIGIDLGLFNNRIQFTADVYKKNTQDLLFSRITPPSSGYGSAVQNIGEVENKGVEFFLKTINISNKSFTWNTTLNLSINRSKVTDLGKTPDGKPVDIIYTSESLGWFPIVLDHAPYQPWGYFIDHIDKNTGTYTFKDINHDNVVDGNDQDIIGNFEPKFIFGFINDLTYKNFDFSVFINGSVGNDVFVDAFRYSLSLNGNNNILKEVYDGMESKYPRPNADYGYSGGSSQNTTALIFDGTYVRFKAITLGYTIPFKGSALKSIRVYATGSNLITIDNNYPWYDPEVTAGPTANADVVTGWDRGGYANNKSVVLGVKVNF